MAVERSLEPDDFIAEVKRSATVLEGFVSWDSTNPDVIFFAPGGAGMAYPPCPNYPIPKDKLENIKIGSTYACIGAARQMWSATIQLKAHRSEEEAFYSGMISLLASHLALKPACNCHGASLEVVGAEGESLDFTRGEEGSLVDTATESPTRSQWYCLRVHSPVSGAQMSFDRFQAANDAQAGVIAYDLYKRHCPFRRCNASLYKC